MEMVRTIILIVCIVILFSSCEFFLITPFPNTLTMFSESYVFPSSSQIYDCRMYIINDYLFININLDNSYYVYIFSPDLEVLYSENTGMYCDTFAMLDDSSYYLLGNNSYTDETDYFSDGGVFPSLSVYGLSPPYGYGFSYNTNNFYIWWDDSDNSLNYYAFDSEWTSGSSYDIQLPGYEYLKALYFNPDANPDPLVTEPTVIMFFDMDGSKSYDLEIAEVPASFFADGLTGYIPPPDYFYYYSAHINDIEADMCYYTGDGYVVERGNGNLCRYNKSGKLIKEIGFVEHDQPEAYTMDGKTRYVISRQYGRLMKTPVWW